MPRRRIPPVTLFDMDDTLFDHSFSVLQGLRAVRAEAPALRRLPMAELIQRYDALLSAVHPAILRGEIRPEVARRERIRRLLNSTGASAPFGDVVRLAQVYRRAYLAHQRPVPGARALLEALHGVGRIGIVTNNRETEQRRRLRRLGLWPLIDALTCSETVGVTKPDPAIFRHALRELGTDRRSACMVGDSWRADILGALGAGLPAIWFNRSGRPWPMQRAGVVELQSFRPRPRAMRSILDHRRLRTRASPELRPPLRAPGRSRPHSS